MGVQEVVDSHYEPHGNRQGLSVGWLGVIYLVYVLQTGQHQLVSVQDWVSAHQYTLERLTDLEIRETDFTDDRLADLLRYLNEDTLWRETEQGVSSRTIRVYDLDDGSSVRLDATVGKGDHKSEKGGLFQVGRAKDGGYESQFKLMMSSLDPLGLPIASLVVSGEQGDDGLYLPVYHQTAQTIGYGGRLYIGDCKMAALETRATIAHHHDYYLTPLPLTGQTPALLSELLALVNQGQVKLQTVTDPDADTPSTLAEGCEFRRELSFDLDDETVRWAERLVLVRSPTFAKAKQAHFLEQLQQAETALLNLTPPPARGKRQVDDPDKLQRAVDKILDQYKLQPFFTLSFEQHLTTKSIRAYADKPARTQTKSRYQLHLTRNQTQIDTHLQQLGWRLYVTNAPFSKLDFSQAVLAYRDQYLAEQPFARLKGKLIKLLPLYTQRDDHSIGLIRLLTLALRLLQLLQFLVRRSLQENDNDYLDHIYDGNPKRKTASPSAELILHAFDNIGLFIRLTPAPTPIQLAPLNQTQLKILNLIHLSPHLFSQLLIPD